MGYTFKRVPTFSSNRTRQKSDMCTDHFINKTDQFPFCRDDIFPDDHDYKLGDSMTDASEALQYTIEDASNLSLIHI